MFATDDYTLGGELSACRDLHHRAHRALCCAWSCASEQHYSYAWDEVNRIAEAPLSK